MAVGIFLDSQLSNSRVQKGAGSSGALLAENRAEPYRAAASRRKQPFFKSEIFRKLCRGY